MVEINGRCLLPRVAENFLSRLVQPSQFAFLIVCENNVVRVFEQFTVMFRQRGFAMANRLRLLPNVAADEGGPDDSDRHASDHQKQSPEQLVELRRDRRFRRTALCQREQRIELMEKSIQKLEAQVNEIFRHPPLMQNDH